MQEVVHPKEFQTRYISRLIEDIEDLRRLNRYRTYKEVNPPRVVLLAPPGSGKTFMMSQTLDVVAEDSVVLFCTPGMGELQEQAYAALSRFSNLKVVKVTGPNDLVEVDKGTILVINYEKVIQTYGQYHEFGGQHKNLVTRIGEGEVLWELLRNLGTNGTDLIQVLDEAHIGSNTKKSKITTFFKKVAEEYGSHPLQLEMTATPNRSKDSIGAYREVDIPREAVVHEGLVKKYVHLNPADGFLAANLRQFDDPDTAMLKSVWDKREELVKLAKLEGRDDYNPLILVCINNASKGSEERKTVERFFKDMGVTVEGGGLATHFSGDDKENHELEELRKNSSTVKAIIFKTALVTGWDCPRAHLMMMTRDVKDTSVTFSTQLLGRILRQPYGESFQNEELNVGYLYTRVDSDYQVPPALTGELEKGATKINSVHPHLLRVFSKLNIKLRSANRTGRASSILSQTDNSVCNIGGSVGGLSTEDLGSMVLPYITRATATMAYDRICAENGSLEGKNEISCYRSHHSVKKALRKKVIDLLKEAKVTPPERLSGTLIKSAVAWVQKQNGYNEEVGAYVTLLVCQEAFEHVFNSENGLVVRAKILEGDRVDKYVDSEWSQWIPSEEIHYTDRYQAETRDNYSGIVLDTSLYGPPVYGTVLTNAERTFEKELLPRFGDSLQAWMRNEVHLGRSFTLTYDKGGNKKDSQRVTTYPDYCIALRGADGVLRFLALEIKGRGFTDGSSGDTIYRKAEALRDYQGDSQTTGAATAIYQHEGGEWYAVLSKGVEVSFDEWLKDKMQVTLK